MGQIKYITISNYDANKLNITYDTIKKLFDSYSNLKYLIKNHDKLTCRHDLIFKLGYVFKFDILNKFSSIVSFEEYILNAFDTMYHLESQFSNAFNISFINLFNFIDFTNKYTNVNNFTNIDLITKGIESICKTLLLSGNELLPFVIYTQNSNESTNHVDLGFIVNTFNVVQIYIPVEENNEFKLYTLEKYCELKNDKLITIKIIYQHEQED
jgi:hypothetical protein